MAKKIIEAIINRTLMNGSLDSCNIHCINITPMYLYGFGFTELQAKEDLHRNLRKLVGGECKDKGFVKAVNEGDFEFRYLNGITMNLSE